MAIYYLGAFPPGYGGVTVKNQNLFTALRGKLEIEKIDFNAVKRKDAKAAWQLLQAFFDRKNIFVIGVSGKKTRRRFCRLLYHCNRPAMNRSIIFLMGGSVSKDIAADVKYQKYMREYKRVYVETHGMRHELESAGLTNVGYYPNGRFRPAEQLPVHKPNAGPLRCVFFSLIRPQKGADLVLEAAKQTPEISYAFYGAVDAAYKEEFLNALEQAKNVGYHGVFSAPPEAVYNELRKYDVLLFPSRWIHEGVPGTLVEAKIAGVPAIVSDICYNAEIVEDGVSGIVLKENTPAALSAAISALDRDRARLLRLKVGARQSAETYYIENYLDDIAMTLRGGVSCNGFIFCLAVIGSWPCKAESTKILAVMLWLPPVRRHA